MVLSEAGRSLLARTRGAGLVELARGPDASGPRLGRGAFYLCFVGPGALGRFTWQRASRARRADRRGAALLGPEDEVQASHHQVQGRAEAELG